MSGSALASCAVVGKIRTTEPLRTWAQGAVTVGAHSMGVSAYTNIKSVCVCVCVCVCRCCADPLDAEEVLKENNAARDLCGRFLVAIEIHVRLLHTRPQLPQRTLHKQTHVTERVCGKSKGRPPRRLGTKQQWQVKTFTEQICAIHLWTHLVHAPARACGDERGEHVKFCLSAYQLLEGNK